MSSRRVSIIPDQPPLLHKEGGFPRLGGNNKRATWKVWSFQIPKGSRFSAAMLFRRIEAEVVKALSFVSGKRRCSRKVSSASLARSRSYAEALDSQRAEAIEDCIEFLNSSSTLPRSNSVSSSC